MNYKVGEVIRTKFNLKFLITGIVKNAIGEPLDRYYGIYDDGSSGEISSQSIKEKTGTVIDVAAILEEM